MTFSRWELKKAQDYISLKPNLFSKSDLDFVTRYALFLEQTRDWEPDSQSPNVFSMYKNTIMDFLQFQLHELIEKETGLTLLPTYNYFRIYRNGAILDKHKDRHACEISATMLIGKNYSSPSWELHMEGDKISQEVGDVVIYRGCELEHWREPWVTEPNNYHVQLFVHFVDADGPFEIFKGDEFNHVRAKTQP